jgi:hypothetical protein
VTGSQWQSVSSPCRVTQTHSHSLRLAVSAQCPPHTALRLPGSHLTKLGSIPKSRCSLRVRVTHVHRGTGRLAQAASLQVCGHQLQAPQESRASERQDRITEEEGRRRKKKEEEGRRRKKKEEEGEEERRRKGTVQVGASTPLCTLREKSSRQWVHSL